MVLDHISVLSLKELCLVKIAIAISNDPEVHAITEVFHFSFKRSNRSFVSWTPQPCFRWGDQPPLLVGDEPILLAEEFPVNGDDDSCDCLRFYTSEFHKKFFGESRLTSSYMRYTKWKKFIEEKVSFILLPNSLEKDLLNFVRHISLEVMKWLNTHSKILHDASALRSSVQWKSRGFIDREETAKSLIRNEKLSLRERYALASFYCFKDDAVNLWGQLTWGEKYLVGYDYPSLGVWNKWMKGERIDWESLADYRVWIGENNIPDNRSWKFFFYLGVRTLFPKLSCEKKVQWLHNSLKEEIIDYEEFLFCVSHIENHEKENFFKEYPFHVLVYFLDWPLQGEFFEVADHLWTKITGMMFFLVLHFIIYEKIVKEWSEFNYFQLLKRFWCDSPIHLKEYIQTRNIFEVVMIAIDCQNKSSFINEEVVKYCEQFHFAHHFRETDDMHLL